MSDERKPKHGDKEDEVETSKDASKQDDESPDSGQDDESPDSGQDDESPDSDEEPAKRSAPKAVAASESHRHRARTNRRAPSLAPAPTPVGALVIVGILALAGGALAGWFGRSAQASAALKREMGPAPSGSAVVSGPCGEWQQKVCASLGERSSACDRARGATELLTTSTCEAALESVPATVEKVKVARAGCDKLVTKLCADLPPGSKTCDMVKERTPSFAPSRCDQMLENYGEVIAQLKQMDQQSGNMMGHPGSMRAPGAPPSPHGPPPTSSASHP